MKFRPTAGSAAVELPVCLLVLFIIFFFPLLDLAVCAMRANTLHSCARDASRVAARAMTFSSAKNLAGAQLAVTASAALKGITIDPSKVQICIVTSPMNGGTVTRSTTPLAAVDTTANLYQIEVSLEGAVQPLVTLAPQLFGSIPGISAPMIVKAANREFAEHPEGLKQ